MATTVITTEDLVEFKAELLQDIENLLQKHSGGSSKKWLRSPEAKEMLGVSSGTLQNLRINGTLPYTKMGGVIYYAYADINKVLENNKIDNSIRP